MVSDQWSDSRLVSGGERNVTTPFANSAQTPAAGFPQIG